ncbi:ATP-binding protein [Micromonospora solifontis]|uniref:ATP-binding protein n=1 Tax=Micromonospora TaxID=1873 RepID=UPI0026CE46FF
MPDTVTGADQHDEVLATAILDRLLHHCDVVPINGPSYRLKNRLTAIENVA